MTSLEDLAGKAVETEFEEFGDLLESSAPQGGDSMANIMAQREMDLQQAPPPQPTPQMINNNGPNGPPSQFYSPPPQEYMPQAPPQSGSSIGDKIVSTFKRVGLLFVLVVVLFNPLTRSTLTSLPFIKYNWIVYIFLFVSFFSIYGTFEYFVF